MKATPEVDVMRKVPAARRYSDFITRVLVAYLCALQVSCGVNVQQNGYKDGSTFLQVMGIAMIALGLVLFHDLDSFYKKFLTKKDTEGDS